MKGCRPFTDQELEQMEIQLRAGPQGTRNVAFFLLGWQTGFRISEILALRLGDVVHLGEVVQDLKMRKAHRKGQPESLIMYLPARARMGIRRLVDELGRRGFLCRDDFLFQTASLGNKAITRTYAWGIIRRAADAIGLDGSIGTHSMRKTFAQKVYDHCKERSAAGEPIDPLTETKEALGHENVQSTIHYLGLRNENTRRLCQEIFDP